MRKRKNLESVAGDTTHAAQDLGKDALAQAGVYLQQAQEYLTPLAKDAKKKGAKTDVVTIPPFAATKDTVAQIKAEDRW